MSQVFIDYYPGRRLLELAWFFEPLVKKSVEPRVNEQTDPDHYQKNDCPYHPLLHSTQGSHTEVLVTVENVQDSTGRILAEHLLDCHSRS